MAVYFIQNPTTKLIKIGKSKTVSKRLVALSRQYKISLKLLGVVSGGSVAESDLHIQFSADRIIGEWFKPTKELLEFIEIKTVSLGNLDDLIEVKTEPKIFLMGKNNIPIILEKKGWTRYRLWQALGGSSSARTSTYRLGHPDAINKPIPFSTGWDTLKKIAKVLEVGMDDLESSKDVVANEL